MRPPLKIVLFLLYSSCLHGQVHVPDQTCVHNDLSKTLTIVTMAKRVHQDQSFDSARLTIRIIDKAGKQLLQEISLIAPELYAEDYTHCRLVRSYSTGKNAGKMVTDNDYGDIIVADLNFDSREDLAVKTENNNGGTYYTFYTQTKDKKFVLDRYLTDSVYSFPWKLNPGKRTLTTMLRAGVRDALTTYHLDGPMNKWTFVKRRVI
jgi:hypothetical protein